MLCRTCGTEIAERALVCYRCGAPTATPRPKVRARRRGAFPWGAAAAIFALVAAGVLLGPRIPGGAPRWLVTAGLAIVVLAIARAAIRRRAR